MNSLDYKPTLYGYDVERGDCNVTVRGSSEGFFFPQNLTKSSQIKVAYKYLCRPLKLHFKQERQVGSLRGYEFTVPDNFCEEKPETEPSNCIDDNKFEIPEDLCDISKCLLSKCPTISSQIFADFIYSHSQNFHLFLQRVTFLASMGLGWTNSRALSPNEKMTICN